MKPPPHRSVRTTVRLKPGRIVRLPPRLLKHTGWRTGDVLFFTVEDKHATLLCIPEKTEWRIDRLRQRTGSTARLDFASLKILTYGNYLALRYERRKHNKVALSAVSTASDDREAAAVLPLTRKQLQQQWTSLVQANEKHLVDLAGYLEREHPDLVSKITKMLGDDATAVHIAKAVQQSLFMEPGDAWKEDVERRIMASVFCVYL